MRPSPEASDIPESEGTRASRASASSDIVVNGVVTRSVLDRWKYVLTQRRRQGMGTFARTGATWTAGASCPCRVPETALQSLCATSMILNGACTVRKGSGIMKGIKYCPLGRNGVFRGLVELQIAYNSLDHARIP